ncbi:MAG TPA: putative molybdenum carrier protein, partial [Gammaproteobacteria bacterium]|nr:putative molybdenum carrier protein [Gammaproteobacteria bacterium]
PGAGYPERTERNVVDADATLILARGPMTGGTRLTAELARRHGKPFLVVDLATEPDPQDALAWLRERAVHTLNVAGPRESGAPGIHAEAVAYLRALLAVS